MFELYYQLSDARRQTYRCAAAECVVGRGRGSDLTLSSRQVARRQARFSLMPEGLFIDELDSRRGCWVNGKRIRRYGPISELDEITLGDVRMQVGQVMPMGFTGSAGTSAHCGDDRKEYAQGELPNLHTGLEFVHKAPKSIETFDQPLEVGAERSSRCDGFTPVEFGNGSDPQGLFDAADDAALNTWSRIVHERLLNQMDLRRKDVNGMSDSQLREESSVLITHIVDQLVSELPVDLNVAALVERVLDEAIGLGPLEQFLTDDTVTEIMVNNHRDIFLERNGRIERSPQQFSSDRTIYAVIERIITPLGRRIDESSPIVDARLKDGSRVNAVIPPLALKGPCLTIRKFPKHRLTFEDLVSAGSVDQSIVDFLQVCVQHRKNIVVAGGTGSGKTTLLNVLSNFIPDTDRIVTIEDAAELRLVQPNLVSLESRPPNLEGRGAIPMRDLVRNALRMRPDRIVIGECRGGEAIDMLQAMNTGHDGSLTTVHANNPRDVISRLEVLVLMAGMDLPVAAIREQIASAVDLVIQQTRFPCGARKITRVTEVAGLESGTVQLQDIFLFRQEGFGSDGRVRGSFRASGSIPGFYESLSAIGHQLDLECFEQRA